MNKVMIVALGGAAGAVARYWLSNLIHSVWTRPFPLWTFVINVTGSLLAGFFLTLVAQRLPADPHWTHWQLLIVTGFAGAYTTFSTFEFEIFGLIEDGKYLVATLYVTLSLMCGLLAVFAGVLLARKF